MLQTLGLIWGLLFVGCAASLEVQIIPRAGGISIGDSKFFICEVTGDAKDIDWYDPRGERILPNGPDIFVSRNDESSSTLTIYHAKTESAGIYKCVAKNDNELAEDRVHVEIFQKITFESAPNPQEFNEGDNADIICNVVSSPSPSVFWRYKGAKIQPEKDVRFKFTANHHLLIHGIKKTDEGMYRCEARVISRGEIDFRMIKVIVNVLPSVRALQLDVNATADINSSALLACNADGFPEPTVTWARNNIVLESGDKYSLNEDGSELVIKDVKKVDEGDYTCIAKNKAGEKSEEVSLNVFVQPKITYLNNLTASEFDKEVTLTCEASGDPTPTIAWSFGKSEFTEGEQSLDKNVVVRSHARVSSLTLKNVQFTYAGQYLCTASNSIGQDNQNVYLEVRYAPKILGAVATYTWEGNPTNISCDVEAYPLATVLWFRDGIQLPSENTTDVKIYNTPMSSYLEITPDSQNDYGSYNCTASNVMGTESKEFLLIQADVPSSPEIQKVEPFSSTALIEFEEPDSTGGVPIIKYRVEWRLLGQEWKTKDFEADSDMTSISIFGLKPESNFEVKMSAINGKGEGEISPTRSFKTEPVRFSFTISTTAPTCITSTTITIREPSAPKLEYKVQNEGNTFKVNWIKQDDGGSPIMHYLIRYKPKRVSDWKPEIRLPQGSEHVLLSSLDWNTEYEVLVVAENQQGKSKPGSVTFKTALQPTTVPGAVGGGSSLSTGAIVGILIAVFFLLLVGVDVTCYFLNKCGLLMCIAVNFCGKAGQGSKGKDIEEGKAAFTKDESKEPIVEVRTEEENTANQEGGGSTEPNETTPLTEPEPAAAETPSTTVNLLPTTAANSVSESVSTVQGSPASECTTLTTSACSPTKAAPAEPSAKNSPAVPSGSAKAQPDADVGPLVDLTTPTPPVSEPMSLSANGDGPQTQSDHSKAPDSSHNKDSEAKDAPNTLCTDPTAPAHNNGKTVKEDKTKGETEMKNSTAEVKNSTTEVKNSTAEVKNSTTEVKNSTAELKTIPNEAPQANGNESKA